MTGRREGSTLLPFIDLVKSHECIWNHSIAAYSKTDLTSAAWKEIASKMEDTEKNCRERWKNIRTAYVRSLRPRKSGSSQNCKRTYYLSEHLDFLQPYLKVWDMSGNFGVEDTAVEKPYTNQNDESELLIKEEMPDEASFVQILEESPHEGSSRAHKRRNTNEVDDVFIESMNMQKVFNKSDEDAEHHFLLSLLPDMKNLSSRRRRTFKIQTMSLLYQLLEEDEEENS